MYENKCAICGQPIIGYWYEIGEKNVCHSCAASTTVYDLFQCDIVDIKPDIVDTDAVLLAEGGNENKGQMLDKSRLNAEYGMAVKDSIGYHYTGAETDVNTEATLVTKGDDGHESQTANELQSNVSYDTDALQYYTELMNKED